VSKTRRLLPAALIVVLPLAGCAAGLHDATSSEHVTPWVANATVGDVSVHDVVIAPSDSGSGTAQGFLSMVLSTAGDKPDQLVSAQLDGGGTVTPTDPTAQFTVVPNQLTTIANPETPTTDPGLAINGLPKPLVVGTTMRVTLTFRDAGQVHIQAPVNAAATA
jgi:copper(I)-binding protein